MQRKWISKDFSAHWQQDAARVAANARLEYERGNLLRAKQLQASARIYYSISRSEA